jgi:hypothetical protein
MLNGTCYLSRALRKALQPAKLGPTRANANRQRHNLTWYNPIQADPTNEPEASTNQKAIKTLILTPLQQSSRTLSVRFHSSTLHGLEGQNQITAVALEIARLQDQTTDVASPFAHGVARRG